MKKAVLDLTDCKYVLEMHERFKEALQFPEHYGRNWDAFWDSMRFDSPIDYIEIRGENEVSQELKPMVAKLNQILEEVKNERRELGWEFDYVIEDQDAL